MKPFITTLARFTPPLWLVLALAGALAAGLLAAFVDLLQQNVRHGEELRHWQRVGAVRQPIGTVAAAAPRWAAPQSGSPMSPENRQ